MRDGAKFEELLAARGEVRLGRSDVHELTQKLRARGGTEVAAQLESRLGDEDELALDPAEARQLLDELRASGRRWVGGAGRPDPVPVEPPTPKDGLLRRFWRR